ncbi:MAG: hypothetical protein CME64_01310 [Halobacteriovoraceae bacterium]|nr:hypothetical protein [Halobacteriovoraceae bacterium]|tara:strand:- start:17864 stop:20992 length:3129 start_codon:yes stop_codon:yes gene_type:complete
MLKQKTSSAKKQKSIRVLPLLLALQMFMPTQVMAQSADGSKEDNWVKTAEYLKTANQLGQEFLKQHQAIMQQRNAQAQTQKLQQSIGINPVNPAQLPPILAQNGCMVLEARTDKVSSGLSCNAPLDNTLFQQGHYHALFSVAEQNVNTLENYLTQGHERFTTQGVGCYDKARKQLEAQLKSREVLLAQMKESIEKRIEAFKKLAEKDLEEIRKGDILLNGKDANSLSGQDKDKYSKALEDYKFENQFQDPQCKALFSGTEYSALGQRGGLKGIEKTLRANTEEMEAESFFNKQKQLEAEIRKIGNEAYRTAVTNKSISVAPDEVLGGIRTRNFTSSSKALTQSFSIAAKRAEKRQNEMQRKLLKTVGKEPELASIAQAVESDSADVDQALRDWERKEKNSCMSQHLKNEFGGVDGFIGKLVDPQISRQANREADSAYKNYVKSILSDDRFTVEEKMEKIANDQQARGSRYTFVTGKSFTVKGKLISASTRLRASDLVTLLARDCAEGFKSDPRDGGFSAKDKVKALRSYASGYKKNRQEFASNLRKEIVEGVLNCPSDTSTGSAVGSCGKDATNVNSPGFCVRTANTCASSALACTEKAQRVVEKTRKQQKTIAQRYKKNMDKLKSDLIAEFEMVSKNLEQSARTIDGLYQMGTQYEKENRANPSLTLNFTDTELLQGVDPSLVVEDPDKYKEKVFANISAVEKQIKKHRQDVVKAYDTEIAKYTKNYGAQKNEWAQVVSQCNSAINSHYAAMEAAQKAAQEKAMAANKKAQEDAKKANEKIAEACNKYSTFKVNPCPGSSSGAFGELADDIASIAASSADVQAAQDIRSIVASCDAFANESGANIFHQTSTDNKNAMDLGDFCEKVGTNKEIVKIACEDYKEARQDRNLAGKNICDEDEHLPTGYDKMAEKHIFCKWEGDDYYKKKIQYESCEDWKSDAVEVTALDEIKNETIREDILHASGCSKKGSGKDSLEQYEAAEKKLLGYLAQYQQHKLKDQVGQIEVAACEAGVDSDPSMPDMNTPAAGQNGMMGVMGSGVYGF